MKTPEVILCKFGEVVLKGANRQNFESALVKELRRRASPFGTFKIYYKQSTVYVEPVDEFSDMDGMYDAAKKVFGIVAISKAALCEKDFSEIVKIAKEYLSAIERGVRNPSDKLKCKMAKLYGVKEEIIFLACIETKCFKMEA